MFCPNCGKKLDDEATVCSECGFDIENDEDLIESSTNDESFWKKCGYCVLIIVAMLILIAGIANLNSGDIITINGVNFNIPDGFEEDVSLRINNTPVYSAGTFCANFYKDNNGNIINLGVLSNAGYSSIDEVSLDETLNAVKKNIAGKEGWLGRGEISQGYDYNQYGYFFVYLDGGNKVMIGASDEHLIEEVIV